MYDGYLVWTYGPGLIATFIPAAFGLWLIAKGALGHLWILGDRVRTSRWVLFALGILLQVPAILYIAVGEYTGALEPLIRDWMSEDFWTGAAFVITQKNLRIHQ